jgi:hypothetical protein
MENECDERIRAVWAQLFEQEVSHLHHAAKLLRDFEGTDYQSIIGEGEFPELLCLGSNIEYVRKVIASQTELTALRESYVPVSQLPADNDFARYQNIVIKDASSVPSHAVIEEYIRRHRTDYRSEVRPHPIESLRSRSVDNVHIARALSVHA